MGMDPLGGGFLAIVGQELLDFGERNCYINTLNDRGVEQLVARRAHNPKVAGSSPAPATQEPLANR